MLTLESLTIKITIESALEVLATTILLLIWVMVLVEKIEI